MRWVVRKTCPHPLFVRGRPLGSRPSGPSPPYFSRGWPCTISSPKNLPTITLWCNVVLSSALWQPLIFNSSRRIYFYSARHWAAFPVGSETRMQNSGSFRNRGLAPLRFRPSSGGPLLARVLCRVRPLARCVCLPDDAARPLWLARVFLKAQTTSTISEAFTASARFN